MGFLRALGFRGTIPNHGESSGQENGKCKGNGGSGRTSVSRFIIVTNNGDKWGYQVA